MHEPNWHRCPDPRCVTTFQDEDGFRDHMDDIHRVRKGIIPTAIHGHNGRVDLTRVVFEWCEPFQPNVEAGGGGGLNERGDAKNG